MIAKPLLVCLTLAAGAAGCQRESPAPASPPPQAQAPPGVEREGPAFTFERIQEDIYHAVGTGNLAVGSNASIIVNDRDVLVVDSHISPAAAWALLEELREVTPKPVRYVVNTHFHFDHLHGNQVFPPDVEIIGHEFTREMVAAGRSKSGRAYDFFIGGIPERIARLESELASAGPEERAQLERDLADQKSFLAATDAVEPTAPNVTLSQRMTLFRDGREIQLLFFGRGHTGGDVVVYLPAEKVLITGDLLTAGLPYMGDGYLREWADTLGHLEELDFEVVLPGHGAAFREREKIRHLQAYLRDLWQKAAGLHGQGIDPEEAAKRIDMRNHGEHYPSIQDVGVHPHAVLRVYELLNAGGGLQ